MSQKQLMLLAIDDGENLVNYLGGFFASLSRIFGSVFTMNVFNTFGIQTLIFWFWHMDAEEAGSNNQNSNHIHCNGVIASTDETAHDWESYKTMDKDFFDDGTITFFW